MEWRGSSQLGPLDRRATCQSVSQAGPEPPTPAKPPAEGACQPTQPEENCPADPWETEK